jgi:hypothetical protein
MSGWLKRIGISVGVFAIVFALMTIAESFPYWGWHLQHGSHAEVDGVRIRVPYFYRADTFDGRIVALSAWRRPFVTDRADMNAGSILIGFAGPNQQPLGLMNGPRPGRYVLSGPFQERGGRKLTLAGRSGECKEYSFDLESGKNSSFVDKDTRTIYCWFGTDLRASFLGGPSAQRTFYEVIQSAELAEGKR